MSGVPSSLVLGRYVPGVSPVHLLDPRTKLAIVLAASWSSLALDAPAALLLLLALPVAGHLAAGLSLRRMVAGMRVFLWLFLLTAVLQLFFVPGSVLWVAPAAPAVTVTREGLLQGISVFLRLSTIIALAGLLTATSSPGRLGNALGRLLSPLSRAGLPVGDLVLGFSIGLQFLPALVGELNEIRDAQVSRGILHLHRNPLRRLATLHALFIPVLVRSVRRSEELALAMVNRGYVDGKGRTSLYPLSFGRGDAAAAAAAAAWIAASVLAGHVEFFK